VKVSNLKPDKELIPAGNFPDGSITNYGTYGAFTQTLKSDLAGNWALMEVVPGMTRFVNKGGVCKIFLDSPGNIEWQVQLAYFPCFMKSGNTYRVSFDVRADSPRKVGVQVSRIGNGWLTYSGLKYFEATPEWRTISFVFKSPETDYYSRFEFECGVDRPSLYFRNVSLKQCISAFDGALLNAAKMGDCRFIRSYHGDVNQTDLNGYTALMWASVKGQIDAIKALIDAGADVDKPCYGGIDESGINGYTPLILAAWSGETLAIKALIDAGADVNAACIVQTNETGYTVLMAAACNGNAGSIRELLDAKADVNAGMDTGWTALMEASWYGKIDAVKALIKAGAGLNAKNKWGGTALSLALFKKNPGIIAVLTNAGAR
jgi:hypothetical protein